MTHRNMPRIGLLALLGVANLSAVGNSSLPILQDGSVRYDGQIVAAVVAETQEQADHAATLIRIDYAREEARTRFAAAKADARLPASLLIEKNHVVKGNPNRRSPRRHRVDAVYTTRRR